MDAERLRKLAGGAVPTPLEVAELCSVTDAALVYAKAWKAMDDEPSADAAEVELMAHNALLFACGVKP